MAAMDIKLNLENNDVFIERVAFTYRSGASSTFVTPSARQIAQQLEEEIQAFLAARLTRLHSTDVAQPIVLELLTNVSGAGGLRPIELRSIIQPS